jgi:anti-anti-sigma regulatory factor
VPTCCDHCRPNIPTTRPFEGLLIVRPEGRLFFANAQQVGEDQIRALVEQYKPRVLALDMSRVPDIEYSALQMLMEGEKRATEQAPCAVAGRAQPGRARSGATLRAGRQTGPLSACCTMLARRSSVSWPEKSKRVANHDSRQSGLRCAHAEIGRDAPSGSPTEAFFRELSFFRPRGKGERPGRRARRQEGAGHRNRQQPVDRLWLRARFPRPRRQRRDDLSQRKSKPYTQALADHLGVDPALYLPCDVRIPGQLEAVFEAIEQGPGASSTSACTRLPSRHARICTAASPTARATDS